MAQYTYDLAIACLFKNSSFFLKEWIEHHLMFGVKHFYLCNNNSTDNYQTILEPYIQNKIVELENNNRCYNTINEFDSKIHLPFYNRVINKTKNNVVKWLACIDCDEFITPAKEYKDIVVALESTPAYTQKYNDTLGGIGINWMTFGTSNRIVDKNKNELVTEILTKRSELILDNINTHIKSIVIPERTINFYNPHASRYLNNYKCLSTLGSVIPYAFTSPADYQYVYIRHYTNGDDWYFDNIKSQRIEWRINNERRLWCNDEEEPPENRWFVPLLKERMNDH